MLLFMRQPRIFYGSPKTKMFNLVLLIAFTRWMIYIISLLFVNFEPYLVLVSWNFVLLNGYYPVFIVIILCKRLFGTHEIDVVFLLPFIHLGCTHYSTAFKRLFFKILQNWLFKLYFCMPQEARMFNRRRKEKKLWILTKLLNVEHLFDIDFISKLDLSLYILATSITESFAFRHFIPFIVRKKILVICLFNVMSIRIYM